MSFVDNLTRLSKRFEADTDTTSTADDTYTAEGTTFFELMRNDRRQLVVQIVDDHGDITARTLAERIAAIESGAEIHQVKRDNYKAVYNCLYQTHLEKLDNAGYVNYNERAKEITATDRTTQACRLLASIAATEVTDSE